MCPTMIKRETIIGAVQESEPSTRPKTPDFKKPFFDSIDSARRLNFSTLDGKAKEIQGDADLCNAIF